MPLFGAQMSIAGGLHNALTAAHALGMETVQLFTASSRKWHVAATSRAGQPPTLQLVDDDVRTFRRLLRQTRLRYPMAHDSYLINLASPDEALYRRSIEAFVLELQRAERLGLSYLVTHPGAHMGAGEEAGLSRVAAALDEVHRRCARFRVKVLLETTAGQGTALGYRFEHLAYVLKSVAEPRRIGICLDTCHVFAAGYGLSLLREYEATMREFDRVIGLGRLRAFHLNDSRKPQGSRVDRHAHIGQGCLGREAFRMLINDRRFKDRPMVLETPKEDGDNGDMDAVNLATLHELVSR